MRLVGKFLLLLGHVDGDHIGQRGHGPLLALGVPVEHDLDLDTQHSLQERKLDLTSFSLQEADQQEPQYDTARIIQNQGKRDGLFNKD